MQSIRMIALALLFLAQVAVPAQQVAATRADELPSAEHQLKTLSGTLDLSPAQEEKIKPVVDRLHDLTLSLMQDGALTQQERLARIRPERYKARDQIRAVLNEQQRKDLDAYLQGPHNELHGNLTGTAPPK